MSCSYFISASFGNKRQSCDLGLQEMILHLKVGKNVLGICFLYFRELTGTVVF